VHVSNTMKAAGACLHHTVGEDAVAHLGEDGHVMPPSRRTTFHQAVAHQAQAAMTMAAHRPALASASVAHL